MQVVGRHSWLDEVQTWSRPWEYKEWKAAVCAGRYAHEAVLQKFYGGQWEPLDCAGYMIANKIFCKPPKPKKEPKERTVTLDETAINKRFAMCLWRECTKLLTRRMTLGARQLVLDMYDRMGKQLNISGDENST